MRIFLMILGFMIVGLILGVSGLGATHWEFWAIMAGCVGIAISAFMFGLYD